MPRRSVTRFAALAAACALAFGAAGCAGGQSSTLPAAGSAASAAEGKTLVEQRCTQCHPVDRIVAVIPARTSDEWTATVARMEGHGLVVTDAERAAILSYFGSVK